MTDYSNIYMNPEMSQQDLYAYDKMKSYGASVASPSTMFGSASQSLFPTQTDFGPGVGFRSGQMATSDYGIKDFIKHDVLDRHRALGTNARDTNIARKEYGQLWGASATGEAGAAAIGAAAGMAIGGIPGMVIGGTLAMAGETLTKPYMQGYGRVQQAATMTSNVLNRDGTMGLSGKDNKDLAKFMQESSHDDMYMEEADYQQMLKKIKSGGGMKAVSAGKAMAKELENWTDDIKELSSLFNDGNIEKLADEMLNFVRKGMSRKGAKSMITTIKSNSEISDMTEGAISDVVQGAYHQAQVSGYIDERAAAGKAANSVLEHKALQGTGLLSGNLLQGEAFVAAAQSSEMKAEIFAHKEGISSDQISMLAKKSSEENGTSFKDEFSKFSDMSVSNVLAKSKELLNDHESYIFNGSKDRVGQYVRENVSDEEMAEVSGHSRVQSLMKQNIKNHGYHAGMETTFEMLDMSKEEGALAKATYLSGRLNIGHDEYGVSSAQKAKKANESSKRTAQDLEEYDKYTSVWETTKRKAGHFGAYVSRAAFGGAGEDAASRQIDSAQNTIFGKNASDNLSNRLQKMSVQGAASALIGGDDAAYKGVVSGTDYGEIALSQANMYAANETVNGSSFLFSSNKNMDNQRMNETGYMDGRFKRDKNKSTALDFISSRKKTNELKKSDYNDFAGIEESMMAQVSPQEAERWKRNISDLAYQTSIRGSTETDFQNAKNANTIEGHQTRSKMIGWSKVRDKIDMTKAKKAKPSEGALRRKKVKATSNTAEMVKMVQEDKFDPKFIAEYYGGKLTSEEARGNAGYTSMSKEEKITFNAAVANMEKNEKNAVGTSAVSDKEEDDSHKLFDESGMQKAWNDIDGLHYSGFGGKGDLDLKKLSKAKATLKRQAVEGDVTGAAETLKGLGLDNLDMESTKSITGSIGSVKRGDTSTSEFDKAGKIISGETGDARTKMKKDVLGAIGFESKDAGESFLEALAGGKDIQDWKDDYVAGGGKLSKRIDDMSGEELEDIAGYAMKFGESSKDVEKIAGNGVSVGEAAIVVELKETKKVLDKINENIQ